MRIAVFVEHYPAPYKSYFDTQFAEFIRAGHDVSIYAGGSFGPAPNEKVVEFELHERTEYYAPSLRSLPRHIPHLLTHLGQATLGPLQAIRATAGTRPRRRVVDMARALSIQGPCPDLCLVHGLSAALSFPWLRRALPGVPVALYYHGGELPTTPDVSDTAAAAVFRNVDVVFTNTEFARSHAVGRGCPPDRIHVLPVGFAPDDFTPPVNRAYRRGGLLRLLSAGRMSEEKGFEFALQAVKTLVESGVTDIRYDLTGNGYYRRRLEEYVRAQGLEQYVRFLGTLSTAEVIRAMGEADVLVLPSIQVGNWVENQACAVQEAMLMKAVVIVSRTGGVPESIPHAMEPFVCEPGDADDLSGAIRRIHALDCAALCRLGETGREFVRRNYDIRDLNRRMIETVFVSDGSTRYAV